MKILETKEDFLEIKAGDRIHHITDSHRGYVYAGAHPQKHCEKYFIAISGGSVVDASVDKYPTEDYKDGIWTIGYDSKEVGELIKNNLLERIKSVENTYGNES